MTKGTRIFEILAIIYILLEPVLIMYGWATFNIATILIYFLVLSHIYSSFRRNRSPFRSIPKLLTIYFIWLIFCNYISMGALFPFGNIFIWLVFCTLFSTISSEKFWNVYKIVALIAIGLFIIQEVSYYTLGYRISGIIQWLPMSYAHQDIDFQQYISSRESLNRSASFFSEPAHFAQFLFPILTITLFKAHNFRSFVFPILVIMTLLLLQSGNAMIGLAVIGFVYMLKLLNNKGILYKILTLIVFTILCCTGGYIYLRSSMGENLLERQDTISGDMDTSSGFFRIYRGYYVFAEYSSIEKIFGLNNFNKIKQRRDSSKISFLVEGEDDLYFNCFQHFLLRTGLIGASIFVFLCLSLWRKNTFEGKAVILTFFVLSFVASLYLSTIMMLYIYVSYTQKRVYAKQIHYN